MKDKIGYIVFGVIVLIVLYVIAALAFGLPPFKCGAVDYDCQIENMQNEQDVVEENTTEMAVVDQPESGSNDPTPGNDGCQKGSDPYRLPGGEVWFDGEGKPTCIPITEESAPTGGGLRPITGVQLEAPEENTVEEAQQQVTVNIEVVDVAATSITAVATCQPECSDLVIQWTTKKDFAQEVGLDVPEGDDWWSELQRGANNVLSSAMNSFWTDAQFIQAVAGQPVEITGLEAQTIYLVRAKSAQASSEPLEIATTSTLGQINWSSVLIIIGGIALLIGLVYFIIRGLRGWKSTRPTSGRDDLLDAWK